MERKMLFWVIVALFRLNVAKCVSESPQLWVVDTDVGADDGMALSLLLAAEATEDNIKLAAITAVQGNTNVDNVARNILKILDTAKRTDIPVYKGMNYSLLVTPPSDNFFGNDGFGDVEYPNPPPESIIKPGHAVNFLVDIVRQNPGKINLLAIGPLTNIAMASRMDATFLGNLADIVVLGGSIQGVGNVKPGVEFNVYVDPEAVSIVFDEAQRANRTIRLVSWEAALQAKITMDWRRNVLGGIRNPLIDLLNKAERINSDEYWISSDSLAALWAINTSMPHIFESHYGMVEVCGATTRGATVIDYNDDTGNYKQIGILTPGSIDIDYVKKQMLSLLSQYVPL